MIIHYQNIYKKKLNNKIDLINKDINFCKIDYLTIIILGKSGVGKSTLVNSMLKKQLAKTAKGGIQTKENKCYQSEEIPFLRLYDTRGLDLEQKLDSDAIYKNAMKVIKESEAKDSFNDCVQCIWYCFHNDDIENVEIELINNLRTNNPSIPIILIYTYALSEDDYNNLKKKIDLNFPNLPFIKVLAEGVENFPSFGLNYLLELTLQKCKNEFNGKIYKAIRQKSYEEIKNTLFENHELINKNIINEITNSFVDDFKRVLINEELLNYVYEMFEKIFNSYIKISNDLLINNFDKNLLQQVADIKTYINNFILHYTVKTKETVEPILEILSIKFLDLQLALEKKYKKSLNIKNKKNKEGFKEIIQTFLNDNFYYISQKYIIYRLLHICEKVSLQVKNSVNNLVIKLLEQREPEDLLKKIYQQKFKDLENEIAKRKIEDNKIYEEKKYIENIKSNVYEAAPIPDIR